MARSRTSGQGRPKGSPNKINASLREMILGALDAAGGEKYLARVAVETPGPFLALLGKVLPTQMTGEEGRPLAIDFRWADASPADKPEPEVAEAAAGAECVLVFAGEADEPG